MSFVEHLEALRWHLFRCIVAIFAGAILALWKISFIFDKIILGPTYSDFISYRLLCKLGNYLNTESLCIDGVPLEFQNTQLYGQFYISITTAAFFGLIISFPYIIWELWKFVKPALKPTEYKYSRSLIFWSSFLFFIGIIFAYYIILPFTLTFFANYTLSDKFQNNIIISNYFSNFTSTILGIGMVFELPILIFFFSKIGLITPKFLQRNRKYAIFLIFVISVLIAPPDLFSMFFIALPLMLLYEVGIVISKRTYKPSDDEKVLDW